MCMLPQKIFFKFRGYAIASETIFVPIQCLSEVREQSFTGMPFCPLCRTPLVSAFRSSSLIGRKPHPPFAGEACETNHSLVRTESCWKEDSRNSSVALFAAISQVSTWYLYALVRCVGVSRAMAVPGKPRVRGKVVWLKLD